MRQTIKAKDVKPGMLINRHEGLPAQGWAYVKDVRVAYMEGRTYFVLVTGAYETWKHPEEEVAVQ